MGLKSASLLKGLAWVLCSQEREDLDAGTGHFCLQMGACGSIVWKGAVGEDVVCEIPHFLEQPPTFLFLLFLQLWLP